MPRPNCDGAGLHAREAQATLRSDHHQHPVRADHRGLHRQLRPPGEPGHRLRPQPGSHRPHRQRTQGPERRLALRHQRVAHVPGAVRPRHEPQRPGGAGHGHADPPRAAGPVRRPARLRDVERHGPQEAEGRPVAVPRRPPGQGLVLPRLVLQAARQGRPRGGEVEGHPQPGAVRDERRRLVRGRLLARRAQEPGQPDGPQQPRHLRRAAAGRVEGRHGPRPAVAVGGGVARRAGRRVRPREDHRHHRLRQVPHRDLPAQDRGRRRPPRRLPRRPRGRRQEEVRRRAGQLQGHQAGRPPARDPHRQERRGHRRRRQGRRHARR